MKKLTSILLIAALFLLPILARGLWFYRGIYLPKEKVQIPDFASFTIPEPPVSTPSAATSMVNRTTEGAPAPVIMFDMLHSNLVSLSEIEPLTHLLAQAGARVINNNANFTLAQQLKAVDSFVVISPTYAFLPEELAAVQQFVEHGGRLLVITDPTRSYSMYGYYDYYTVSSVTPVDIANLLLDPWQIAFANDYVYNLTENEGNFRNIIFTDLAQNELTTSVSRLIFYSAHSLSSAPNPIITGDDEMLSSDTDTGGGLPVAAIDPSGQVLAIGDMSFMTSPYSSVADNAVFLRNLANFLTSSTRQHDLTSFPYVFTQPVQFLMSESYRLDTEKVGVISSAQRGLSMMNIKMEIAEKPQPGFDLLIAGTYADAQKEELAAMLEPFELVFEDGEGGEGFDSYDYWNWDSTPTPYVPLSGDEATPTPVQPLDMQSTPTPVAPFGSESNLFDLTATPTPYSEYDYSWDSYDDSGDETEWTGTITVPGLGKVESTGNGLILFHASGDANQLVLLASSESALNSLALLLTTGDLTNCVVQPEIAVCALGYYSDYSY